jgi:hypothetical protein
VIARYVYHPMRPKTRIPPLDRYAGPLPKGWEWQVKIDDERGIVRVHDDGSVEIFNRHWEPLAAHKAKLFAAAAGTLPTLFPGEPIFDVALLGFRGHWAPGGIVLLDVPSEAPWTERRERVWARDSIPLWDPLDPKNASPEPGAVVFLPSWPEVSWNPRDLFLRTKDVPGVEGLIGRDPAAPYQMGDSDRMVKIRWK